MKKVILLTTIALFTGCALFIDKLKDRFSVGEKTYTLKYSVVPQNGGTLYIQPLKEKYSADEMVTITAIPTSGWYLDKWIVNGVQISKEETELVIKMDSDKEVIAYFAPAYMLVVSVEYPGYLPAENYVSIEPPIDCTGTNADKIYYSVVLYYPKDEEITLTAFADYSSGYSFVGWLIDGSTTSNENPLNIRLNKSYTNVKAIFNFEVDLP